MAATCSPPPPHLPLPLALQLPTIPSIPTKQNQIKSQDSTEARKCCCGNQSINQSYHDSSVLGLHFYSQFGDGGEWKWGIQREKEREREREEERRLSFLEREQKGGGRRWRGGLCSGGWWMVDGVGLVWFGLVCAYLHKSLQPNLPPSPNQQREREREMRFFQGSDVSSFPLFHMFFFLFFFFKYFLAYFSNNKRINFGGF